MKTENATNRIMKKKYLPKFLSIIEFDIIVVYPESYYYDEAFNTFSEAKKELISSARASVNAAKWALRGAAKFKRQDVTDRTTQD